jgi:hypothetical protein
MSEKIMAVLDQIETEQRQEAASIPDNIPIPELAEQVVRGKVKLSPQQLRVLIELLPFHAPKLSAVAHGQLRGEDFFTRLDRAVARSDAVRFVKFIEGRVVNDDDDR